MPTTSTTSLGFPRARSVGGCAVTPGPASAAAEVSPSRSGSCDGVCGCGGCWYRNADAADRAGGPDSAPLLTALVTATSAACVTGLIVVDTPVYWSGLARSPSWR